MRPEIRLTPPRRARRRMAGLVIPSNPKVSIVNIGGESNSSSNALRYSRERMAGRTYGCCREGFYDDVWLHLFQDPCRLFHVLNTRAISNHSKNKINFEIKWN